MELNDICPTFITEDSQIECKARLEREETIHWLKTVAGFANAKGGVFYLGVENGTFKLIGFDKKALDKEKLFFQNELTKHFPVLPLFSLESIPYRIHGESRYILKVKVPESSTKPVILKYDETPSIFVRRDGYTNGATYEEIILMANSSRVARFDSVPTDIPYKAEKFRKLDAFCEELRGEGFSDKELDAIRFFDANGNLYQGSSLFSDDYDGAKTAVACSSYMGLTRGDDRILASESFKGNLIDAYRFVREFVDRRSNHGFLKKEQGRIDIDSFPGRALFEAIINALAHRDYLLTGTQISVDLFPNRLVISTPGNFFNAGELKPTYNIDSIVSRRRNELICSVFVLCHAMEAKGTGFEKIVDEYKEADDRHKPFVFSRNNQFTIVLPDLTYKDGVDVEEDSLNLSKPIEKGTRFDLKILSYCLGEERSAKEIAEYLGIADSTFLRKSVIENLVSQSFLLERRERASLYVTNPQSVSLR